MNKLLLIEDQDWEYELLEQWVEQLGDAELSTAWVKSIDDARAGDLSSVDWILLDRGCAADRDIGQAFESLRSAGFGGKLLVYSNVWLENLADSDREAGVWCTLNKRDLDDKLLARLIADLRAHS